MYVVVPTYVFCEASTCFVYIGHMHISVYTLHACGWSCMHVLVYVWFLEQAYVHESSNIHLCVYMSVYTYTACMPTYRVWPVI